MLTYEDDDDFSSKLDLPDLSHKNYHKGMLQNANYCNISCQVVNILKRKMYKIVLPLRRVLLENLNVEISYVFIFPQTDAYFVNDPTTWRGQIRKGYDVFRHGSSAMFARS